MTWKTLMGTKLPCPITLPSSLPIHLEDSLSHDLRTHIRHDMQVLSYSIWVSPKSTSSFVL